MKKILFAFSLLFIQLFTSANLIKLSDQASFSLITVSPGEELYSSFGHSTILLEDYQSGISVLYNYGTFDFNTENFYLKFLKGTLPYQLTKDQFNNALEYWTYQKRLVTKQRLRLSQAQKQELYKILEENYLPTNRTYQYKFFFDNCSTRPRDMILKVLGDEITFKKNLNADKSYRFWVDTYAGHKAIADFGMDIALGVPSDNKTGYMGAMYIPDNLMMAFDSASISVNDSTIKPFVIDKSVLNSFYIKDKAQQKKEINIPIILGGIMVITSIILFIKRKRITLYDKTIFFLVGVSGIILLLLWFFTNHGVTSFNLNILWASPLALLLFFLKGKKKRNLYLLLSFLALIAILIDVFKVQAFPFAAILISVALIIRYFSLYKTQLND